MTTFTMKDFVQADFSTDKTDLLVGKIEHQAKTIEDFKSEIASKIEQTISALNEFDGWNNSITKAPLANAPFASRVQGGISIKIGIGRKNEGLFFKTNSKGKKVAENAFFPINRKANQLSSGIAFLRAMKMSLDNGGLDEVLTVKLVSFQERAEAGKRARQAQADADKKAA